MNKQQQMQEILKETVDYYSEDPQGRRAVDDNGDCMYTTIHGRHCAIGRYMKKEFLTTEFDENHGVGVSGLSEDVDNYLIKEVHGLSYDFWCDLQDLHDKIGHWLVWSQGTDGLREHVFSAEGRNARTRIKNLIERGDYNE